AVHGGESLGLFALRQHARRAGRVSALGCELRLYLRADLRPERVDREEALRCVDVPESPAVARLQALRQRADAVDGADRLTQGDRAVGAHQRLDRALGIA